MLPEPYPTECYCWGSGAGGALGETVKVQLTPKRFDLPRKHIANVFAGDRRTIAQTSNGDAYSWGSDPLGRKCTASNKAVAKKLKSISSLVKFSHGDTHSVAIDINGRAFSFGDAAYGKLGLKRRRKVELPTVIRLGGKCIDISCGVSFTALLLDSGEIVVYGLTGMNGRDKKHHPHRFKLPVQIISVASGASHCVAISSEGKVYTWGIAENGRLGHGHDNSNEMVSTPTCVDNFCERNLVVTMVSCGSAHTAVVTDSGNLFTFGWNYYNQCGKGDRDVDYFLPDQVNGEYQGIVSVSCGFAHTGFITKSGKLYCFGFNEDGQLGVGHERNIAVPTYVIFNENDDQDMCVINVSCGKLHTVAVVAPCTISEFRCRQQQIEDAKNAIRVLQRFSRWIIFQKRPQLFKEKITTSQCNEPEETPIDGSNENGGSKCEEVDESSSEHSHDESLGSLDYSPKNDLNTKPSYTYTSRISEMMAMEGEEDLAVELSRRLNTYRNNLRRKKMKIVVETVRRHEALLLLREDKISAAHRKMKMEAARTRKNERNKERIGNRNNRVRNEVKKVASRIKMKTKKSTPEPQKKVKWKPKDTNYDHLVYRKNVKEPPIPVYKPAMLPSRNKNKRLLRQRSERLQLKEREKRKLEEQHNRIKCEELAQLHKLKEVKKRHAMAKVQTLKSIINVERRKRGKMFVELQEEIHPGIQSRVGSSENFQPKNFKSVKQWSRNFIEP